MTDYVVHIGTQFDTTGMLAYQKAQQGVSSSVKDSVKATKEQNTTLSTNTRLIDGMTRANNNYTMSAKAQAAAMRGVPAQITDIVVSLQGGQRPLTVLLQQGGQLKDMFGGIRPAIAALSTTLLGMINPVTVLGAAVGGLAFAFYQGAKESEAINRNILLTGNQSRVSAGQIQLLSSQIANATNTTKSLSVEMLNAVVASTKFSGETVGAVSRLGVELKKLTGGDIAEVSKQIAGLGDDPLNAVLELNRSFLVLTDTQYQQIKAAQDAGDINRAAQLAADALTEGVNKLNDKLKDNKNWFDKATESAAKWASTAWDAIKNLGRQRSEEERLNQQLAARQEWYIKLNQAIAENDRTQEGHARAMIAAYDRQIERNAAVVASTNRINAANTAAAQSVQLLGDAERNHWNETASKAQKAAQEIEAVKVKYDALRSALSSTDTSSRSNLDRAQMLEIETIQARYAEVKRKVVDRELQRDLRRQNQYFTDLKDMAERSATEIGRVQQAIHIQRYATGLGEANRVIDSINAEAAAYEKAGFIMRGYSQVSEDLRVASIDMAKNKALELGIIKSYNEEIDTSSSVYLRAVEGARQLAQEEKILQEARTAQADLVFTKNTLADYQLQRIELGIINSEYVDGLIPNSRKWSERMAQIRQHMLAIKLVMDGLDADAVAKITEEFGKLQSEMINVDQIKQTGQFIESTFSSAFDNIWSNGKEGFSNFLQDLAKQLIKSGLLKLLTSFTSGYSPGGGVGGTILSSIIGAFQANGGAWNNGVQMFANGGVVNRTTPFGMAGGRMGIMGEAGPEAIMPLKRGADGKLGVAGGGGGGTNISIGAGAVVVNASPDSQEDAQKTMQAINQLINVRVREVISDQQRAGNSMNPIFGQRY